METGISLYFASGYLANAAVVEKASLAGAKYAFTSFHIPEESGLDFAQEAKRLIALCRDHGLALIADVSPATLAKLGCRDFGDVGRLGVEYIRLDDGFDARQTVELSNFFHVVFNASTISESDIAQWRAAGADFSRFAACHNFYPKPLTGLSIEDVARTNQRLKALGFEVMGFVPGDRELRGPLHEGLPTVEAHRGDAGDRLFLDMLELASAGCDAVLVGDPDVSKTVWKRIAGISQNVIDLAAELAEPYQSLFGRLQHDRPDSSPWIVRSQESRRWKDVEAPKPSQDVRDMDVHAGDILMSTTAYGRYAGELEIARQSFALDRRDVKIGRIAEPDLALLPYIRQGAGFRLVKDKA
jgi:hypothetical protein